MSKYKDRYGLSKAITNVFRKIADASILFSVMDELLILSGDDPVLPENRERVNRLFAEIKDRLGEITITLAEDKHGRIRK